MKVKNVDRKILKLLQEDSRRPFRKIATDLKISEPTLYNRVKKLQEELVIEGFTTIINPDAVGFPYLAFIMLTVEPAKEEEIINKLMNLPEIMELHILFGEKNILLKIRSQDIDSIRNFINNGLRSMEGILKTETYLSMKTEKETHMIPI
ncbi:MAG: Lrp/AsnC family transcriptional regulator [Candidatus Jordarchaeum sp.]|uniref:Lrp/AsnC family transcriptional regulator n=1 Tax=Candidatus Jordarchaeum sp. TaxID=2823881 RepID=UPI004049D266